MEQAEPNLKVTDRRHFTAEGDVKTDAAIPPDTVNPTPPPARGAAEPPPVTLSSFVVSIASQAAEAMGGEHPDLGAARQMISAIEMLKDKTEGRRTDDESRIVDAVLFDLRLAFVGSSKGPRP